MKLKKIWVDTRGASVVEFALVVPAFVFVIFGFIAVGLLMWTYFGLEHSVEVAARCGAINYSLTSDLDPNCKSTGAVQTYAQHQYWGINPLPQFVATAPASASCTPTWTANCCYHVQVSPSYNFTWISDALPGASIKLNAQSCYPVVAQ
jgi:Flp pilus assembly protein TadG